MSSRRSPLQEWSRQALLKSDTTHSLPAGFIDALIGYALDPTAWEAFAQALNRDGQKIEALDPTQLLTTLSQAETLAWQLRGESGEQNDYVGCDYFLLDKNARIVQASEQSNSLSNYCSIADDRLIFVDPDSADEFEQALAAVTTRKQRQALVSLHGAGTTSRYGYMVAADDLPAAFNLQNKNVHAGFLIAPSSTSTQAGRVLQTSFGLTPAESEICQHLNGGLQLKQIAKTLNISPNTVRNQLQAVFDKTKINRQSDLILMMTQLQVILSVIAGPVNTTAKQVSTEQYPPHQFVILSRGDKPRRLAYRTYGSGEQTVIYFHESMGCSRLPPGTDALASQLGLTLIAFERPGTGFSDPVDQYSFETTSADVEDLMGALELSEVSLLGYLAGAAHALAAAARLQNRVKHLMLVSGRGPAGYSHADGGSITPLRQHLSKQPWLLKTFFNILRSRATESTNRALILRFYGASDSEKTFFAANPGILEHIVNASLESLVVSASGVVGEIRCLTNPQKIDLNAISAPVSVWHGESDTLSPLNNLLVELEGLEFDLRVFEKNGCTIFYQYWQDVLQSLAGQGQTGH
jgi:pimeloyl-ACP methyl ester carboxylesterase/DNA-binding CsgD family transcriptional regulator